MRFETQRVAGLLLTVALLGTAACSRPPTTEAPPPNLLLISIDTLRTDRLGCYGHYRETSPRLDALAADGLRFTAAYAPTPWTLPSHASMLTGMHPYEIGIDNQWRTLPEETPMVAELLTRAGYASAAFVDSSEKGFVGAGRGFGRGFGLYQHAPHRPGGQRFDMAATVDAALAWLEDRDRTKPFFLFLHTKSVHAAPSGEACLDPRCFPYDKPEPYQFRYLSPEVDPGSWTSPEDGSGQAYLWSQNAKILRGELDPETYPDERIEVLKALYDAGIYYVDVHLGRLFEALRQRGLDESTAIVVTSDHGEAFLDHSLFMHQEVYDTQIRVPLVVRLPSEQSVGGQVIERQVTLADVVPTLLRLARAEAPEDLTGRPLPLTEAEAAAETEARELFAYYLFPGKFTYQGFALRRGDLKLVTHNVESPDLFRHEVYDIAKDPKERHPLAQAELHEELAQALGRRLRTQPIAQGDELRSLKAPSQDVIRSLGYIE